ncbi:MAG: glycosyltransferase family 2 protein [Prevotella sp.]|nr:glycosyltransferase family 2 protein [Prevotella sp.]
MKKSLSILIPTFNDTCLQLVRQLNEQATHIDGLAYEILVADDGSTDASVVETNQQINSLPHCRFIRREENVGRSTIRNILAKTAQYEWLLFVDSDMSVAREDFIKKYVETEGSNLYGGYIVTGDERQLEGNLRFIYEKKAEGAHTFDRRQQNPYADFHTSNFLIDRTLYEQHPLDTRFRHYGYEDVLMGKELQQADIHITHIDNPLAFATFEDNPHFVEKTEEGLRTLAAFKDELEGYSRLLAFALKAKRTGINKIITFVYKRMSERWRNNLCGNHPSLSIFKWYKLGYLLQLLAKEQA